MLKSFAPALCLLTFFFFKPGSLSAQNERLRPIPGPRSKSVRPMRKAEPGLDPIDSGRITWTAPGLPNPLGLAPLEMPAGPLCFREPSSLFPCLMAAWGGSVLLNRRLWSRN